MSIRGKDGADYANVDEVMKANARWEQQQKQNKLLEEQNRLLKEQQKQQEEQNRLYQQQQEYERIEAERARQEQEYKEIQNKKINNFTKVFEDTIVPLMLEAGIKDPVAYYEKLLELYDKPNKEKELKLLDINNYKSISDEELQEYPTEIQGKIKNLKVTKHSSNIILVMGFVLSAIIAVIGLLAESEILLISAIFPLSICGFISSLASASKKSKKKLELQTKENIQSINLEIKKHNQKIKEDNAKWEEKVRNFEKRRIENFNYPLEIALDQLTLQEILCATNSSELEYLKQLNFNLQFNEYPRDWEMKRKQYYDNKSKEKAKAEGTEIFEDL